MRLKEAMNLMFLTGNIPELLLYMRQCLSWRGGKGAGRSSSSNTPLQEEIVK